MPATDYAQGFNATTATAIDGFQNGLYRIIAGASDVTVAQKNTESQGFQDIGKVTAGESKDIYLDAYSVIKCTFSGTCTIKRIMGVA
ncbi:MAG: hypothetical protein EBU90_25485 [Proteobacteria bacterium]|nr:hypothetical protein [Pseudomonadota bacterium]